MDIYQPAEDSYLLNKFVKKVASGKVLDMGTGSGIQALTAVNSPKVKEVLAVDINKTAITVLQKTIHEKKLKKIKVLNSDLFEKVTGQFGCIIFNPPYLPQDKNITDAALYGGKKGWEISEHFFQQVSNYLTPTGIILFLFSSLTNKSKIEQILTDHLFQFKELGKQKLAFEELYVYKITKTTLLKTLEKKGIKNIHYFAHGKRGVIYAGTKTTKQIVAIKVNRKESTAVGRITNEAKWLKLLNKRSIGPKLLFHGKDYLTYEFVQGKFLLDWLENKDKGTIKLVLISLLQQCFELDQLKINKEELHRPFKHILITKENQPVLIDFERCYKTDKPHNLTQFIEFICRIKTELEQKGFPISADKLRELAKQYKENQSKQNLNQILNLILR
ncbi:MAG: HemK2/MTQ2 family protein methyltransferase [Nanoarchaeota archaeon]